MRKQHAVVLSEPERARLHTLIGQGTAPTRARILLRANQGEAGPGWTDRAIATALEAHPTTVARVPAARIPLGGVRGQVGVNLGLQGGGQHPPRAPARLGPCAARPAPGHRWLHSACGVPSPPALPRRRFQDLSSGRYAALPSPDPIPNFRSYLLHRT
jgi:hypothetical protein